MSLLRFVLILALVIALTYILVIGKDILIPLVLAVFLWYLINAMADAVARIYPFPVPVRMCAAISTLVAICWLPIKVTQATIPQVVLAAPKYQRNLRALFKSLSDYIEVDSGWLQDSFMDYLDLPTVVSTVASGFAMFATNALMIFLYVGFLLFEQGSFMRKLPKIFRRAETRSSVISVLGAISDKIRTYLWVKTFVSFLTGVFSYIVLLIVGVDFAAFWAVVIFFLNYIPNVGSFFGVVCPALLALLQFNSFYQFLAVIAPAGLMQFVLGNVLEPKLMGSSLNLSPFVVIFSLVVWGGLWGIVGAFLSVPLMVIVMIVLAEFPDTRPIAVLLSSDGDV